MRQLETLFVIEATRAVPITSVQVNDWPTVKANLPTSHVRQAEVVGFEAKAGTILVLQGQDGAPERVIFGLGKEQGDEWSDFLPAKLLNLPEGIYRFETAPRNAERAVLALALQAYNFDRYKAKPFELKVQFITPQGVNLPAILAQARAIYRGRDLINTPANDLGTQELAAMAQSVAQVFGAGVKITVGEALEKGFPLIHAVGKASPRMPLLFDMVWGKLDAPKITLVGKGVVFDTGGLDIKPANAMLLMKKDMGGAATALALAEMIMAANLNVRLRLLIPSAENAIAGNAFRPNDIYPSRKGMTVEIGDTDAEGRLILADALALADEESPDYIFNFATLTGAARVAMGPEVVPFFSTSDDLAAQLSAASVQVEDPLWRLPFWQGYDGWLKGNVADLSSTGSKTGAGCITAALFLKRFVENAKHFAHFDVFAWNPSSSPARPEGGEILAARAVFEVIKGLQK